MIKILLLAANPTDTTRLRLDAEIREIDNVLRQADFRDRFLLEKHTAVRVTDLQGLLLRHKPDIVHFSGHGNSKGEILVEDENGSSLPISVHALGQLFAILGDNVRCVVLNACYSEHQAKAIAEHVDCVIGMSTAIGDAAAISFSASFYQALGYGKDIKTAFDLGGLQINLENLGEENTPKLLTHDGINPSNIFLFKDNDVVSKTLPFVKSYDSYIDAIRNLLKATFSDSRQFDLFCRECFSQEYASNIPLSWKFEIFIKYCQEYQQLSMLLIKIEEFDKQQYKKYIHNAKQSSRRSTKNRAENRVRAEFSLPFPVESFTPELQAAAINAIAFRLNIPSNEIKVIEVHSGSTKIILEIPSTALDNIISMIEADRLAVLNDLGISFVIEMLDEPFNLENIRTLLVNGFTLNPLIDFCSEHFGNVLEQLPQTAEIDAAVRILIEYLKQEEQIPVLLTLVKQSDPIAYDKFLPYYVIPRKPFERTRLEIKRAIIFRKKMQTSWAKGIGSAAIGSAVIFILVFIVALGSRSGFLSSFMWILLVPLGKIVGKVVVKSLGAELRSEYQRVSGFSFVFGFLLAPLLLVFILTLVSCVIVLIHSGFLSVLMFLVSAFPILFQLTSLIITMFLHEFFFDILFFASFTGAFYFAYKSEA